MPVFALMLFFSGPLISMASEMMSNFYSEWIYSWLPMRFIVSGLREIFFFGGELSWNTSLSVLVWIAGVTGLFLFLNHYLFNIVFPQVRIASNTGRNCFPCCVSEYSTFGGTTLYTSRCTIPSSSNSRNWRVKIPFETPGTIRNNSLKRITPCSCKYEIIIIFHRPAIASCAFVNGHTCCMNSLDVGTSSYECLALLTSPKSHFYDYVIK